MNYELYFMALSGGLYVGCMQANHSHYLGGLVHFGGKLYLLFGRARLAGSVLRNSLYVGIQ